MAWRAQGGAKRLGHRCPASRKQGKISVMNLAQAFQDLMNRPTPAGLAAALGISGLFLLIGCALLLAGKRSWVGVVVGGLGLLAAMAVLFSVDQQSVTSRESESVSVTRPRFRERTRTLARAGMVAIPAVAAAVALGAWAAARRRRKTSVPGLVKAGRMHLVLKEYSRAVGEFSRAIRIAPYLAEAYCGRGMAYQALGDSQRALADFDRAIDYDPRQAPAFNHRAQLRTKAGDLDGALADLNQVMELQPSDPESYLNRGICFFKKGLVLEAAADFQRVLKLTNHSDFAEPAKEYLRQLDGHSVEATPHASLAPPQPNGATESTALQEPKTEDYVL
jgi:tetratricopeptide (TPR) repeat protein